MAKDKLTDYSATNASNTDIGGVNIDEGMLPSDVNNALREQMTHLKNFAEGTDAINALDVVGGVTAESAVFDGTGAVKLPVGTTAQRPTPVQGQIRYNTTDASFEGYDGSAWGAIGGAGESSFTLYEYTATSGQTTFSGADDNAATLDYTVGNILVTLNGVVLDPADYTATTGTSVVLASGAATSDVMNIVAFSTFSVADTVSASSGGTFSGTVNFGSGIDVTGTVTADGLTVDSGTTDTVADFRSTDTSALIRFTDSGGSTYAGTTYQNGNGAFIVYTGGDTAGAGSHKSVTVDGAGDISFYDSTGTTQGLFWDASTQRLGLGTTSPAEQIHIESSSSAGLRIKSTGSDSNLLLQSNDGALSSIFFGDVSDQSRGLIRYDNATENMFFSVNNMQEAARIDSSGILLVGKSTSSTALQGIEVNGAAGLLVVTRNGYPTATFNRLTSDGDIIDLRKDSTTVGSIGVLTDRIYLAGANEGIAIDDDLNALIPSEETGAARDNASDLGSSGARWRNIYVGSGVYLGGTGSANQLDDYEEGTFTPTIGLNSGGTTVTYTVQTGFYTKVGNIVHALVRIENSSHTSTTNGALWRISGLPFTTDSSDAGSYVAYNNNSGNIWGSGRASNGNAYILIYGSYPSSSSTYLTITYRTTA